MNKDKKKNYFINPLRQTTERIELYEDNAGENRWRCIADNGLIIAASSEGFQSQQGALNNAKLTVKLLTRILKANELY